MKKVVLLTECGKYVGYGALIVDSDVDVDSEIIKIKRSHGDVWNTSYTVEDVLEEVGFDFEWLAVEESDI